MEIFGYTIGRKKQEDLSEKIPSIVPQTTEDGAVEIAPGGAYGTYVDLEGKAKSEAELVSKYREMSIHPECDIAIQDIVNESIIMNKDEGPIHIVLDNLQQPESIKKKIKDEFNYILKLLDFSNQAYDTFRRWYIDGRLFYYMVIEPSNPRDGIKELRYIDPRKIRKIKEQIKTKDKRTNATVYLGSNEYFIYNSTGVVMTDQTSGVKISKDAICYVHSGLFDNRNNMIYSHLHKAIKPLNQLRMLEDAVVIYRLARAPERRIFYIDVGNLPKMKAEQYLRDMMVKHKNKLTYDAATGEVRDDRKFMTMLEDFWLPRREGGKGTEITTLPGGQNLGEMEDVDYFRKKLYKSLNVPITRMEAENQFNLGRASEITRDELKFGKFIDRLRLRFSHLFDEILEIQLSLKGIMSREEWKEFKQYISYDYVNDNHFTELKETEIMRERLQLLNDVENYNGKYFSKDWIRKNILRQTDDEIKRIDDEISKEVVQAPASDDDKQSKAQNDTQSPEEDDVNDNDDTSSEQYNNFTQNTVKIEEEKLLENMKNIFNDVLEEDIDE